MISQENIKNYTINDLVAPLYGPTSQVPENCILDKYIKDELQLLDLEPKDFIENSKLLCFKGNFRRMLIKPDHVEHRIIRHEKRKEELQSGFYTIG